jgi:hypothetical protein
MTQTFLQGNAERGPNMTQTFLQGNAERRPNMTQTFLQGDAGSGPNMPETFLQGNVRSGPNMPQTFLECPYQFPTQEIPPAIRIAAPPPTDRSVEHPAHVHVSLQAESPRILWTPYGLLSLVPILSHTNPVDIPITHSFKVHFNTVVPHSLSGLVIVRAACYAHTPLNNNSRRCTVCQPALFTGSLASSRTFAALCGSVIRRPQLETDRRLITSAVCHSVTFTTLARFYVVT